MEMALSQSDAGTTMRLSQGMVFVPLLTVSSFFDLFEQVQFSFLKLVWKVFEIFPWMHPYEVGLTLQGEICFLNFSKEHGFWDSG